MECRSVHRSKFFPNDQSISRRYDVMPVKRMIARIALILLFLSGSAFGFIESLYMRDHAAALGERGSGVIFWMWIYRSVAISFLIAAAFVTGSFFRR